MSLELGHYAIINIRISYRFWQIIQIVWDIIFFIYSHIFFLGGKICAKNSKNAFRYRIFSFVITQWINKSYISTITRNRKKVFKCWYTVVWLKNINFFREILRWNYKMIIIRIQKMNGCFLRNCNFSIWIYCFIF